MTKKVFIYVMMSLLAIQISEHIFSCENHLIKAKNNPTEIPSTDQTLNHYISHFFSFVEKITRQNPDDTCFFLNSLITSFSGSCFVDWVWKPPKC